MSDDMDAAIRRSEFNGAVISGFAGHLGSADAVLVRLMKLDPTVDELDSYRDHVLETRGPRPDHREGWDVDEESEQWWRERDMDDARRRSEVLDVVARARRVVEHLTW